MNKKQLRAIICLPFVKNWDKCFSELDDPLGTLQSMVRSQASSLPGHIQAVYVHNIVKLSTHVLNKAVQENNTDVMEQVGFKVFFCVSTIFIRLILKIKLKKKIISEVKTSYLPLIFINYLLLQIFLLKEKLSAFICSSDLEVQERSSSAVALLECLKENPELALELSNAFVGELNPVAPKAQKKVRLRNKLLFCLMILVTI